MTDVIDKAAETREQLKCVKSVIYGLNQDGSRLRVLPIFCKKWSCPKCSKLKASGWQSIGMLGKPERFITLTLRYRPDRTPRQQAERLKEAWPKLLQRIRRAFGSMEYMLVYELQKNGTPHIHVLQRGCYIPQGWLSKTWHELTKDSFKVDVRAVKSDGDISRYVCKYLSKTISDTATELTGMRIISKSKNWVVVNKDDVLEDSEEYVADVDDWYYCFANYQDVRDYLSRNNDVTLLEESANGWVYEVHDAANLINRIDFFCDQRKT
jgi:hypothetical protein